MIIDYDNLFDEPIYVYTRSQALNDGELINISEMAKQAGFKIDVAVTRAVWMDYIEWTDKDSSNQILQDTSGRMWDILWMLYLAITKNKSANHILYNLYVVPRDGKTTKAKLTRLKAVISAGDNGEPVMTIMLPSED